jgi:hypothetical protein
MFINIEFDWSSRIIAIFPLQIYWWRCPAHQQEVNRECSQYGKVGFVMLYHRKAELGQLLRVKDPSIGFQKEKAYCKDYAKCFMFSSLPIAPYFSRGRQISFSQLSYLTFISIFLHIYFYILVSLNWFLLDEK